MFGPRLRLARKRTGLSMHNLAAAMTPKISVQAISKYEAGKMLPSAAVLIGLGKALDISLDFLMGGQVELLDDIEFHQHSSTSACVRAEAEATLIDSMERYLAIEHILDMHGDVTWINQQRYGSIARYDQIDERADQLRKIWNLGLDPIPSLCKLLEEKGIKVVEANLPESINGLSCNALQAGKTIAEAVLISSRVGVERKRFTLAHALAHRIIHSPDNSTVKSERAMDRFAGAFLVPSRSLQQKVGGKRQRISESEIVHLKHAYGVSAAVLLVRLGQVGVLPQTSVDRAFITFARSWRKTEPEPIREDHGFAAVEKPSRFKHLVWRAVGEQLISPVRAAALLNDSLESIEKHIGKGKPTSQ